ncbi:MAG: hypothetical protein JWN39_3253, partial [Ilumatobacteraceae bacterium]|nr:hypothetical protein [Ilumatobacteraceae bacterium]
QPSDEEVVDLAMGQPGLPGLGPRDETMLGRAQWIEQEVHAPLSASTGSQTEIPADVGLLTTRRVANRAGMSAVPQTLVCWPHGVWPIARG